MSARENILARLRQAPAGAAAPLPSFTPWLATRPPQGDRAATVARFKANIEAAHAEVHDTTTQDWPQALAAVCAAKQLQTLLFGPHTPHGERLAASPPAGLSLVPYDRPIEHWRDRMFDGIDAGITTAVSAIADTGSLVLWPDAAEPRLLSLVPPLHIVLVDAARIHRDLHAAMTAERWAEHMPTNALVISGPSKTADIQQTLAYGAHGPRELVVLLCHPDGDVS
jgi:L-lactate dehydrogenase complex protein LldG